MWFLLIPIAWLLVSFSLARMSGWAQLSKRYACREFAADETGRFRTATFGPIQYHSSLTFGVNNDGLQIAMPFLFRLGHPPLVVPWAEMHRIELDNRLYSHRVKVSFGKPAIVRATLPGWVRYRMPIEIRPH
ncbi:hypothetical protein [Rubripirellula reticaptiva]|uniref:Uncharacterized protein n=1 Tax=Rubripirellula reticaptiva TaxID=2528013 RepID=A0A5C6EPN8_9BACT|nr:hypothetical protein [Rubripirellula reticaptiva]TWU49556.1 hypothetical protein Poly59_41730 [Rubripirellula reticaptiva]